MATLTCLLFLTLFCIISGFDCSFVYLKCNEDSHGRLGQQSLLECIVMGDVPIERVERVIWKKGETALLDYKRNPYNFTSKPGFTFAEPRLNENNLNVSILLSNTTMADIGNYVCIVITNRGHCRNSTRLGLSATVSIPTIGVTEDPQQVLTPSCDDGVCDPERSIDPHPESQLAAKVAPPVVVVLVIGLVIGLLFLLKRQSNKCTHEEIPTDNQDICNGEHQPNQV